MLTQKATGAWLFTLNSNTYREINYKYNNYRAKDTLRKTETRSMQLNREVTSYEETL